MLKQFVEFVNKSVDYFAKGWYSITYVRKLLPNAILKTCYKLEI